MDTSSFPAVASPPVPPTKRRRKGVLVGVVVAVVALAAVVGVTLTGGGPTVPGAGVAPAEFVIASTQATLSHHTADLVVSGDVSSSGTTVLLHGTGQADLSNGAMSMTVTTNSSSTFIEQERFVGGHFYLGISSDGSDVSSLVPGKHWVAIPVPTGDGQSSLGAGTVNPVNQLETLTQRGNTVRPLGKSVIDGVTVSGYAVTPSRQTMERGVEAEIRAGKLSAAAAQQLRQASKSFSSFTMDVWFDASGLLQRMRVDLGLSGGTTTGNVTVDFTNYGAHVAIAAPAANDVTDYSTFLKAAQAAEAGQPAGATP